MTTEGERRGGWESLAPRTRRIISVVGVIVVLATAWELYKVIWNAFGWTKPVRPDNVVMPHTWDMVIELFRPVRRGGTMLIIDLAGRTFWTLREALVGFVAGAAIGFGLGVLFVRSLLAERAFMPYVVASQTVPIIAIAPMVVIWGGLDNGSTLGRSHQAWQLNEILGLIFPASNGIGVMNESLWEQTVDVATSQIPELQDVEVSDDAFRTDIAEAALAVLEGQGLDVDGSSYERRDIVLEEGGE